MPFWITSVLELGQYLLVKISFGMLLVLTNTLYLFYCEYEARLLLYPGQAHLWCLKYAAALRLSEVQHVVPLSCQLLYRSLDFSSHLHAPQPVNCLPSTEVETAHLVRWYSFREEDKGKPTWTQFTHLLTYVMFMIHWGFWRLILYLSPYFSPMFLISPAIFYSWQNREGSETFGPPHNSTLQTQWSVTFWNSTAKQYVRSCNVYGLI